MIGNIASRLYWGSIIPATSLLVPTAQAGQHTGQSDETTELCKGANQGTGQTCPGDKAANADNSLLNKFGDVTDMLLLLAGALAVIVIIIGGLRYITSTGDAARVKQAKDTIFYGVIGLVVAILAYAIVKFISNAL